MRDSSDSLKLQAYESLLAITPGPLRDRFAARFGSMQSNYHKQKRDAFEGFFAFAAGESLPRYPLEIFLEVSNVCDLKCAMCPTFSALNPQRFHNLSERDRGLMSLEENVQPLEEYLAHAPVVHAHGYGEPTIHPQFREFISYLSSFEVMVDFFTNGMHMDAELAAFLVEKRVSRITVSMSGTTAEDYENVYIGGKFDKLLAGLDNLRRAKEAAGSVFPRVEVNSIAFKHHVNRFPEFVRLLGEHGVSNIHLKPLTPHKPIEELHAHVAQLGVDVEESVLDEARAIAEEYGMHLATRPFEIHKAPAFVRKFDAEKSEVVQIKDLKAISRQTVMEKDRVDDRTASFLTLNQVRIGKATPCMEPFTTMFVRFSGEIMPCCFTGMPKGLANVKKDTAEDLWRSDNHLSFRMMALDGRYPKGPCGSCISRSAYPKSHNVDGITSRYASWYMEAFGVPFHANVQKQARDLPDNFEIVQAWSDQIDNVFGPA
ncbi:MAG: radical SAM protein [Halioglobus sp.]|nr:radical SAM protein [Halioglobus sp.]